jgi:membrane protease YdiL (CAAX protease family)
LILAGLLLVGAVAANWWFLRGGGGAPRDRERRYRRWLRRAPLAMLVPTLVALAVLGRIDALWMMPVEFASIQALLPAIGTKQVVIGSLVGAAGGLMVVAVRASRGHRPRGAIARLVPHTPHERRWGATVALATGVVEEPFYRLLLPLLAALATGSAVAGFALSTLLFALGHRYQGPVRMLAAGAFGAVLAAFYLISGQLWLVVLLHVVVNAGPMIVWPLVSSSGANPSGRSR